MNLRGQRKSRDLAVPHVAPESLVASAARITSLEGGGWRTYKFGDETWQQETWRLYDLIGEFHFLANWIGSACSRVRIYVANVDDNGRIQQESTDKKVVGLADTLFGSPTAKSEALRMLGVNLTVAGACYIIGRSTDDPEEDDWAVVSCSELRRYGGDVSFVWPDGSKEKLNPERDIIIRVWTPHPRRSMWADCPARAAMPMLWEIERLTRYVFAQIDSRLVSAGMVPIPKETSFPDIDSDITGAEALTERFVRLGSASLKGEGTAAGVVPMFVEMPMEALGKISNVEFASTLSQQAMELRSEAIRRFALAMDVDPSILSGAGEANHWGAWQIMEGQIKIHIEPLMTRICDALTQAYLRPALKDVKGKDPDRFAYWFDTAPLTVRPQRLQDTLNLYEKNIVSAQAVRLAGDYKNSDAPSDDEDVQRFMRELMLRDPNLFQIPAVRKVVGITDEILPPDTVVTPMPTGPGGAGPPPPPPPPTGIVPVNPAPIPVDSEAQNALPGPGGGKGVPSGAPTGVVASTGVPNQLTTFVVANAAVLRALEVAGKRLAGNYHRLDFTVLSHEIHTKMKPDPDKTLKLLNGAWDHLEILATHLNLDVDVHKLQQVLHGYCMQLLESGQPHQVQHLADVLKRRGLIDAP